MSQQIPERFSGSAVDLSHLAAATQQPGGPTPAGAGSQGGPGQQPSGQVVDVPSLVFDMTDQTFEQIVQLSSVVPIVVDLWAEWCQPCKTLGPILEKVTAELGGRLILAKVDVDANPGLSQAFQAQSIPTVVALVGGRPVPLFQGAMPEQQVREVFGQLLQLAAQQGVTGMANAPESGEPGEPVEAPVNPAHAEALEAIDRGDFGAAVTAYEHVLAKAPADHEARAALVQVKLLHRLQNVDVDTARQSAAQSPIDVEAQFVIADLDVSGGHVEDGFLRLLDLFAALPADDANRTVVRERLVELFEVVGNADPRVLAARTRLANLLY
ncbi:MAG: tetratricopeptide repeat protein [Microbacteriaceae bacterium]|nr:tetratricopeptide repeat protein [Microbacteriaceae bacterium]